MVFVPSRSTALQFAPGAVIGRAGEEARASLGYLARVPGRAVIVGEAEVTEGVVRVVVLVDTLAVEIDRHGVLGVRVRAVSRPVGFQVIIGADDPVADVEVVDQCAPDVRAGRSAGVPGQAVIAVGPHAAPGDVDVAEISVDRRIRDRCHGRGRGRRRSQPARELGLGGAVRLDRSGPESERRRRAVRVGARRGCGVDDERRDGEKTCQQRDAALTLRGDAPGHRSASGSDTGGTGGGASGTGNGSAGTRS